MTLAFDAQTSDTSATDPISFTHTPSGTPRAVVVLHTCNTSADNVSGVTYGGVSMTRIQRNQDTAGEPASTYIYFLGSSIPTGAQTVTVDLVSNESQALTSVVTYTAARDCEVLDSDGVSENVDDPTVTLSYGGRTGVLLSCMWSGIATAGSVTPSISGGFSTVSHQFPGAAQLLHDRQTTPQSADSSVAYITTVSDDVAMSAIAIAEATTQAITVNQANETDLAQAIAHLRTKAVGQAEETDLAQAIAATSGNTIAIEQALETDLAQPVAHSIARGISQASETDLAQTLRPVETHPVGQATETDLAQTVTPGIVGVVQIAQATETDAAFAVTPFASLHVAAELDRAQQITRIGGVDVISDAPVLIRAPRKAGRIFHQFAAPSGDAHFPLVGEWEAEEDAPGGFRGARGLISSRDYNRHREVFRAGCVWKTFLEDGTCIFAGTLNQPDPQETVVALSAKGRAALADREIGPILYQTHVGSELAHFDEGNDQWRAEFTTMSHTYNDTALLFKRTPAYTGQTNTGTAHLIVPFFGREIAHLRAHMQGSGGALLDILTSLRVTSPNPNNSSELDIHSNQFENWFFHIGVAQVSEDIEVDLTLGPDLLPFPNTTDLNNYGDPNDTSWGFVWPQLLIIEVGDWSGTTSSSSAAEVMLSNIEVNGAPLGRRRRYSVGDLVEDIANRLGFRDVRAGGAYDITPYELPAGSPASEALDWACLLSGKRYRILDNGARAVFEWGRWDTNAWALASPWSPLNTIPEERFDAAAVPFKYPAFHSELEDQVIFRVEDSPLLRRNVAWGFDAGPAAHNKDKALDLAASIADDLVRPRFTGDFAAAELVDEDGQKVSAHRAHAGDILRPWRRDEPGRLRVGRIVRFDDHVEGEFDGENKSLTQLIERREKNLARRKEN